MGEVLTPKYNFLLRGHKLLVVTYEHKFVIIHANKVNVHVFISSVCEHAIFSCTFKFWGRLFCIKNHISQIFVF